MFGYIYKTTNLINNKIYVGQKKSETFISTYFGSGKLITKAIKKYKKENFKVELLCWCINKLELDISERFWIKKLDSRNPAIGYNLAEGGEGSNGGMFKGKHHSKESIEKHRQASIKENARRKALGWKPFATVNRDRPAPNKGKIRVEKGKERKYIDKEDLENYLEKGWLWCPKDYKNKSARKYPGLSRKEINKILSDRLRGRKKGPRSEETRKKLSEINKGKKPLNTGTKMMYNDEEQIWVNKDDIDKYIEKGYILGRKFGKRVKQK